MKDKNIIYGIRNLIEAINAGKEVDKVMIKNGLEGELIRELKILLHQHQLNIQYVPVEKINRITQKNHQGVIAFLSVITYQKIEDILPGIYEKGETPLFLILDRITDVRNFGAIARSASCMGVHAIIIPSRGAAQIGSDALKTSAGALHSVNICRHDNLKDVIIYLKASGIKVIAASEKANIPCYGSDMTLPLAIILGSEEDGVSPEYLKLAGNHISIPNNGEINSLNVSVAAGVLLYEAVRQRAAAK
jgi:23S rRNA (guanosine2251-2'-O)-methyltransferase